MVFYGCCYEVMILELRELRSKVEYTCTCLSHLGITPVPFQVCGEERLQRMSKPRVIGLGA